MPTHVPPSALAIGASHSTITVLSALLEARTGQHISDSRAWRIDTALKPLLRDRGVESLDVLVTLLLEGKDDRIADQIVDALVNQETSFFREAPVFDMVVEAVTAIEAEGRRARIWSAGCSTGQEPLSLAMLFAERQEATGAPVPEIVATDVSDAALARARSGRYSQFEIQRGLPIRRALRWFEGTPSGEWVAHPELVRMVSFRALNLVADRWMLGGKFDVVLCRNVLLYLSAPTKADIFRRVGGMMRPGGVLVLGAGETVIGQTRLFEPSRRLRGLYEMANTAPRIEAAA